MIRVHIDDPEHMNLLGLLLRGFLERQLAIPAVERKAAGLRGDFGLSAGSMSVTLSFSERGVRLTKGITAATRGQVGGSMDSMVDLVAGGGNLWAAVRALLGGRMRVRGNLFALLPLLPIMLTRAPAAGAS